MAMNSFLQTLNYSSSNEDGNSEIRGLQLTEEDTVLCITGSGARTLDILTQTPATVVSIDFNPCQNFLLELKMQAMQCLEYEEFLDFLGVCPSTNRNRVYRGLRQSLTAAARSFWDNHSTMIRKGVIYQGRWERYFRWLAHLFKLVLPDLPKSLLNCRTSRKQDDAWSKLFDSALWLFFLRCVSSRKVMRYVFGDPGFYRYVQEGFPIYGYLNEKFISAFERIQISDSPFATLLFTGRYNPQRTLPIHLQKRHFKTLRNSFQRVQIVTQSLAQYLEGCRPMQFTKYSLSDFSSYTDEDEYAAVWKGILKTATDGARICERQFLVKRDLPSEFKPFLARHSWLEEELARTDDSIFYTFVVATVNRRNSD
jgi:S-adenosylmethionine-diacylglycerol 3-amino-3-carboxypropyl transferase